MRVFLTGASGQIGKAIALHLIESGHDVIALSRNADKHAPQQLSDAINADLGHPGVTAMVADRTAPCAAIVHAAAAIDQDPHAPAVSLTNCLGTQQMLELAAAWQVRGFVFLSSLPVIGRPRELPITEHHPTDPPTAYHASKLYGEQLLELARRQGLPGIALRLTAPIGPGTPEHRIISVFVRRALAGQPLQLKGSGSRGQDYIDVRDIATAVELALELPDAPVLNVASGRCVTNLELARRCVQVLGSSSEVTFDGTRDPDDEVRWEVSIAAAERAIAFRPRYSLADSIQAVAEGSVDD